MSKTSAFVVIVASYLRFSYHFFPRRESANVLFATMVTLGPDAMRCMRSAAMRCGACGLLRCDAVHMVNVGKQHFREIATPDWASPLTKTAY